MDSAVYIFCLSFDLTKKGQLYNDPLDTNVPYLPPQFFFSVFSLCSC